MFIKATGLNDKHSLVEGAVFSTLSHKRLIVAVLSTALAVTVFSVGSNMVYAGPGDTNSVNTGSNVAGGTYYNTAGNRTEFRNSSGMVISNGTVVRGLEVNGAGATTGNGGHVHFDAGSGVLRVDGGINVNALMSGGSYIGNGGKVTVNAGYVYQNGTITANGTMGGLIQFNVGSMMFTDRSVTQAKGFGGPGGVITVNAQDVVDIQRGALLDVSGNRVGDFNTQVISVKGAVVNSNGILTADGLMVDNTASDGGLIRIVAKGNAEKTAQAVVASSDFFSAAEETAINQSIDDLVDNHDGDVVLGEYDNRNNPTYGSVSANGSVGAQGQNGGGGGTILVSAQNDIETDSMVEANGGRGYHGRRGNNPTNGGWAGTIAYTAGNNIVHTGRTEANGGRGGNNNNHVTMRDADNGSIIVSPNSNGQTTERGTVADGTGRTGAAGGNGGLIAFAYGNQMTTDRGSRVLANGGQGGRGANATAIDYDFGEVRGSSNFAEAQATSGDGGTGGDGGVIAISGPSEVTGRGRMYANGGRGGAGGRARAQASAISISLEGWPTAPNTTPITLHADAIATATGGNGGDGGRAGEILSPSGTSTAQQRYYARDGRQGNYGRAQSDAVAVSIRNATATANATGHTNSTTEAKAATIDFGRGGIDDYDAVRDDLERRNNRFNFNLTARQIEDAVINNSNVPDDRIDTAIANNQDNYDFVNDPGGNNNNGTGTAQTNLTTMAPPVVNTPNNLTVTPVNLELGHDETIMLLSQDGSTSSLSSLFSQSDRRFLNEGQVVNAVFFQGSGSDLNMDDPQVNNRYQTLIAQTTPSATTNANSSNANHNGNDSYFGFDGMNRGANSELFSSDIFWVDIPFFDFSTDSDAIATLSSDGASLPTTGVDPINANVLGLFQTQRPQQQFNYESQDTGIPPLQIGLAQPSMYLMEDYQSVTQEILDLAGREYVRLRSMGWSEEGAREKTGQFLASSGMAIEVIPDILNEINQGNLTTNPIILNILQTMNDANKTAMAR